MRIIAPRAQRDLFITIEEENALDIHFVVHRLFPTLDVIFIARKSIDEEMFFATLGHGLKVREERTDVTWARVSVRYIFQQFAGDRNRNDGPIFNMLIDLLAQG